MPAAAAIVASEGFSGCIVLNPRFPLAGSAFWFFRFFRFSTAPLAFALFLSTVSSFSLCSFAFPLFFFLIFCFLFLFFVALFDRAPFALSLFFLRARPLLESGVPPAPPHVAALVSVCRSGSVGGGRLRCVKGVKEASSCGGTIRKLTHFLRLLSSSLKLLKCSQIQKKK